MGFGKTIRYALTCSCLSLAFAFLCTEAPKNNNNLPRPTNAPGVGNALGGIKPPLFVGSKNGLILRREPNTRSANLGILPFRMLIGEFLNTGKCERIEGTEGCWRQITTAGKTGWIFDGFLKPVRLPIQQVSFQKLAERHCQNISNFCECATKIEKAELKKYRGLNRVGAKINIQLDDGKIIPLTDVEDPNSPRRYRFERRENNFYIFQVCCWEWSERELVNASTGKRFTTFGEQIFSPNGKYMVSFQDEDFSRNGIDIFEIDEDSIRKVFSDALAMNEIRWKDSDHLEVLDPGFLNGKVRHIQAKNGKWAIH